jgi:hypothetical protein
MNFNMKALTLVALVVLISVLMGGAYACSINTSDLSVQVRGEGDYSTSINTGQNTDVDVKVSFTVDSFSGSDCPANISAQSRIFRYNSDTSTWESMKITSSKSQELNSDSYVFVWSNEFNTGNIARYTQFRVDSNIFSVGGTALDTQSAYINVENTSCSGIKLIANNITINEGTSSSRTLRIENNTSRSFSVSNISVLISNSLIRSGSTSGYDNTISSFSYTPVTLSLDAGYVLNSTTTTLQFQVSGYLGGNYCSISSIGTKSFDVTVQNTGSNDNYSGDPYYDQYYDPYYNNYSSTSSDCNDITLNANNNIIEESTEAKPVVVISNNSTKRFEILEIKTTDNGIDLSNYYNDKYVYSDQVADIVLSAIAPSVTADKVFSNTIWVRGVFSDGRTCSFDATNKAVFSTTIFNSAPAAIIPLTCSNFSISVPSSASIKNYGTIPFTINNNTGKRADIFIEGTVDTTTTPTLISLPASSSISRELAVKINSLNGQITFRPVVEGCSLAQTSIMVTNTGEVASAQGQNNASNTVSGALAGLFALGNNMQGVGLVVLAIIIIIIIVGIVASNEPKKGAQVWEQKK